MTEEKQSKGKVSEIFKQLLSENHIFEDVKNTIKKLVLNAQKLTFQAFAGNEQSYLQSYGLIDHEEEQFNYINQILHERTTQFLDRIAENKVQVRSTIPPPPPPPPKVSEQIMQQVQDVLNNIDLPLSLFKRKDHYWSQDNPKTVQVKQYIKQLHEEDRKWKGQLKKKRQQILNEKNEMYHQNNEQVVKQQMKLKEEQKIKQIRKIQYLKSQPDNRKKSIEESIEFIKQRGKPLFKKMEEQFYNKVQLPNLEEKKRKLSEVRELRKSVDLIQIQQHRQKYEKIKDQHQAVKIINQPVKVSYKGNFYKSLQKSNVREYSEDSRVKTLVDKRIEYAQVIRQNFKPSIDQEKANQITERIQLMNKRFARAKNSRRNAVGQDQDDEEGQGEEEQEQEPEPEQQQPEQQEEDDDDQTPKIRDDQYVPSQEERYKMGLKFLEQARKKKKNLAASKIQKQSEDVKNKTFSVKQALQSQKISAEHQTIGTASNQANRKIRYRNYLHEMSKTNKTIDFIDTSQIKSQLTTDLKLKESAKVQDMEHKIRTIEQKARYEQQLLKHRKIKKADALVKKQSLDNAILDTIKARLAIMKS